MVVLKLNEIELNQIIDNIRYVCDNNFEHNIISLKFVFYNQWLEIYKIKEINENGNCYNKTMPIKLYDDVYPYFIRIEHFSMSNFKKLMSVINKEKMKVNDIKIVYGY